MKVCKAEVGVSFKGKGVNGCDAGVYTREGDKGSSPSSVDEDEDASFFNHYCGDDEMRRR